MTQRIINKSSQSLLEVLLKELKEWPREWGGFAVSARLHGVNSVHFSKGEPVPRGDKWFGVGAAMVSLDKLPCDHLHAIVTREYWYKNSPNSPLMLILDRTGAITDIKIESQATQCEYYECPVDHPQNPRQGGVAYIANCEDIIQSLGLTFDEGCEFKSLWRRARARQGFVKAESTALRDAEKAHHYSGRVLAFERRRANK